MEDSWLNPDGKIIEVGECQHNDYARELLLKELGRKAYLELLEEHCFYYPYEILHLRGWVRIKFMKYQNSLQNRVEILGNCIDLTKPMRNTIDPSMNRKQISVAKRICGENNTEFHKSINDSRFW